MRLARISVNGQPRYCSVDGDQLLLLGDGEPEQAEPTGERLAFADVTFLPPVQPTKVLAVLGAFLFGREPEVARQNAPKFTSKLVTSASAHRSPIVKPFDLPNTLDGEAEIGVVLSRDIRRVTPEEARGAILGFTCVNDVTLTGQGIPDTDYVRAKSVDTFGPFGPWIDTDLNADRLKDGLEIKGFVNGVQTQQGTTAQFAWDVLEMVSWASQLFTMRRFDLITLGTMPPVSRIEPGDVMTVEVEGLGTLENPVVMEVPPARRA